MVQSLTVVRGCRPNFQGAGEGRSACRTGVAPLPVLRYARHAVVGMHCNERGKIVLTS